MTSFFLSARYVIINGSSSSSKNHYMKSKYSSIIRSSSLLSTFITTGIAGSSSSSSWSLNRQKTTLEGQHQQLDKDNNSFSVFSSYFNHNNNKNNKINKIIIRNNTSTSSSSSIEGEEELSSILNIPEETIRSIPIEDIRNFSFIAHVDHGKSSLAARVLEYTGNLGEKLQIDSRHCEVIEGEEADTSSSSTGNASTTSSNISKEQIHQLDTLEVEQERGITVKATAASMLYKHPSAIGPTGKILLNMVDTPGHTDFGSEVRRSLMFVQGAVILFDAVRGIQAQTWNVYEHAKKNNVKLIPAVTKIDLPNSRSLDVTLSIADLFDFDPDYVLNTSARARIGIKELLHRVCKDVPSPLHSDTYAKFVNTTDDVGTNSNNNILRAQIIDSWYEQQRGVVCLIQIVSGTIKEGDKISVIQQIPEQQTTNNNSNNTLSSYSVQELGLVLPKKYRLKVLTPGLMGYAIFGIHNPTLAKPGSTILLTKDWNQYNNNNINNNNNNNNNNNMNNTIILPNYNNESKNNHSVIYASVHPSYPEQFDDLSSAVDRLALNDSGLDVFHQGSSLSSSPDSNASTTSSKGKKKKNDSGTNSSAGSGQYLGPGIRVGFQGLLHMEIFSSRLFNEFELDVIVTPPKIPYIIEIKYKNKQDEQEVEIRTIEDLSQWPTSTSTTQNRQLQKITIKEPIVSIRIMSPSNYAGNILELIKKRRGFNMITTPTIDEQSWIVDADMPWAEVVTDFHDELKSATAGYGSFDILENNTTTTTTPDNNNNTNNNFKYQESKLCKVDIVLNNDIIPPLAFVVHINAVQSKARSICQKLHEVLPRQQFVTVIQAKNGNKIIASERIKPYRKDVLTKGGKSVGGGDITRKMKVLEKQKKGKKKRQLTGKVTLSQEAFNSVIQKK